MQDQGLTCSEGQSLIWLLASPLLGDHINPSIMPVTFFILSPSTDNSLQPLCPHIISSILKDKWPQSRHKVTRHLHVATPKNLKNSVLHKILLVRQPQNTNCRIKIIRIKCYSDTYWVLFVNSSICTIIKWFFLIKWLKTINRLTKILIPYNYKWLHTQMRSDQGKLLLHKSRYYIKLNLWELLQFQWPMLSWTTQSGSIMLIWYE